MIPLGLRLTLHGGREAVRRLLLVVAAVGWAPDCCWPPSSA